MKVYSHTLGRSFLIASGNKMKCFSIAATHSRSINASWGHKLLQASKEAPFLMCLLACNGIVSQVVSSAWVAWKPAQLCPAQPVQRASTAYTPAALCHCCAWVARFTKSHATSTPLLHSFAALAAEERWTRLDKPCNIGWGTRSWFKYWGHIHQHGDNTGLAAMLCMPSP